MRKLQQPLTGWVEGDKMTCEVDQIDRKRPYESPQLTTISLRPEEAVLGSCKVLGHSGGNSLAICAVTCQNSGS
jgi:hypothetical protein